MKNKEQLLYFFLQGKISLSQYDYKFMANLQTMIQKNARVTSNQADLFDKLISKYKKQLTKNNLVKEELKALPWKTMVVESTPEYTGATVKLIDNDITIKVPFNKTFIGQFRNTENNTYSWDSAEKLYRAPFSTLALKTAYNVLPKFFPHVRYCYTLDPIISKLREYQELIWNPTARKLNDKIVIAASNEVLASLIAEKDLTITPQNLFDLTRMGIEVHSELYEGDEKLKFAANFSYQTDHSDLETTLSWMKDLGCEHVILGRGLRSVFWREELVALAESNGMKVLQPLSFGGLPEGICMVIQHVSNVDSKQLFAGSISKTIVIQDSRPIEVS